MRKIVNNIFEGKYGGYQIEFSNGTINYTAKTKEGIRGFGVPVFVIVENGEWKAVYRDNEDREITIKSVFREVWSV
jgi:hypothetical protein